MLPDAARFRENGTRPANIGHHRPTFTGHHRTPCRTASGVVPYCGHQGFNHASSLPISVSTPSLRTWTFEATSKRQSMSGALAVALEQTKQDLGSSVLRGSPGVLTTYKAPK